MLSAQLTGRIIIGWLFVFPPPPPGCQGPETCHGVIIISSPSPLSPTSFSWLPGTRDPPVSEEKQRTPVSVSPGKHADH